MSMEEARKRFLELLLEEEGGIENASKETIASVRKRLREEGYQISPALEAELATSVQQLADEVPKLISAVAESMAGELGLTGAMRDQFIADVVKGVFSEQYPDGLTLSPRLWNWTQKTNQGVKDLILQGLQQGESVGAIVQKMQLEIEASAGETFAQVVNEKTPAWLEELKDAGKGLIKTGTGTQRWQKAVSEAEKILSELAEQGTYAGAREALEKIRRAVISGNEELIDEAIRWYMYDRQLYDLKRISRTESATAYHKGQIQVGLDDPDVIGFGWNLSKSHPLVDICDFYANVDFGLGKGVWPREIVPQRKAHPQ